MLQYRDFYLTFKDKYLAEFDSAVSSQKPSKFNDNSNKDPKNINLPYWLDLPWEIRVKIYLTLYCLEKQIKKVELSEREANICRWSCLFIHIGCAKKSKTSKVYVYSFLSALFLIQMIESNQLCDELIKGSGFEFLQFSPVKNDLNPGGMVVEVRRDKKLK